MLGLQLPTGDPWRLLEASVRGQRRLGLSPGLPCLSLAGAPEPQGPPRCTYLPRRPGGEGVLGVGAMAMGRPRQARASEIGEPARERMGRQSSLLQASHQACQEHGWFLPHGRGGVERRGGSCPPHGRTKYKLSLRWLVCVSVRGCREIVDTHMRARALMNEVEYLKIRVSNPGSSSDKHYCIATIQATIQSTNVV